MTGKVIISKEYKDHDSGLYRFKKVKRGREFRGELREYKTKVGSRQLRIYWSARLPGEYYREDGSWAIDQAVVSALSEGSCVTHYGILVTVDSKRKISDPDLIEDYWLATKEDFDKYREPLDYSAKLGTSPGAKGKFGSLQWKLSFAHFVHRVAYVSDERKLAEIMVSKSRSLVAAL